VGGDRGVDLLVEHLEHPLRHRTPQVGGRHGRGGGRGARAVRVLEHHPAAGDVERRAADLVGAVAGHDHGDVDVGLNGVVGACLVERAEVHVEGEGVTLHAAHFEPQRQRVGIGLARAHVEDLLAGGLSDRKERRVGH
jgi:hypothetical protein